MTIQIAAADQVQHLVYVKHLSRRLQGCLVPRHLHEGLIAYFAQRVPTGSFLRACLENDFAKVCSRASGESDTALVKIAQFLTWYTPSSAWGSEQKVSDWLASDQPVERIFE